jgi:hypothetical protein
LHWMSRFGAVFGALLICAGAPGLVSAQGSAPPALVVVVPDSGDKVWLVDFAARQGPACGATIWMRGARQSG